MKQIKLVIGKNFGDEGKGLMTAYFTYKALQKGSCLVVRHNGGAQAGHTVELGKKRFVFHQLGSGSFYGCPTLLTDTFFVDLIKLGEEVHDFCALGEEIPQVFAMEDAKVTTVYDVLLNQLTESLRGENRHGSCGMGIWEAWKRVQNRTFSISLAQVQAWSKKELADRLLFIREKYVMPLVVELQKKQEWNDSPQQKDFLRLIGDENIRLNAAYYMKENLLRYVKLIQKNSADIQNFLGSYDTVVFEAAQGLELDFDNEIYSPHLTASKTGGHNVWSFLRHYGYCDKERLASDLEAEVCYVTRTYVTRHGAGVLPGECTADEIGCGITDNTNLYNEWQGGLRYARHPKPDDFLKMIWCDLQEAPEAVAVSIGFTHLNETDGNILSVTGDFLPYEYLQLCRKEGNGRRKESIKIYLSDSVNHEEITSR